MKHKHNAGFSLVEVLVSIVLLGILAVPVWTSLLLTFRMNEKTDNLLQAQLAVSSAAETMLAEGIDEDVVEEKLRQNFNEYYGQRDPFQLPYHNEGHFPGVTVYVTVIPFNYSTDEGNDGYYKRVYNCYTVTIVSDLDESVSVTTLIREKEADA